MTVSVRLRALLILTAVLFLTFIPLGLLNYNAAREEVREEVTQSTLPLLRENIYSTIQRDFLPALNVASAMANDAFLINWTLRGEEDAGAVVQFLGRISDEYGYFSAFFVSATTGIYYHYDGINKVISRANPHDIWYYDFVGSGKPYDLDVDFDEAGDDRLTIFVNYRVVGFSGELLGVAGVGILMEDFSAFLASAQEKYRRTIYLVDQRGVVQAHSDVSRVEGQGILDLPEMADVARTLLVRDQEPLDAEYEIDGDTILVSSRFMPELGWYLIVEERESHVLRSVRGNLVRTLVAGLVASLLVIGAAAITMDRYNRRIEALATTDYVTGAANRLQLDRALERALYRNQRNGTPVAMIALDADHFKAINDSFGHHVGDEILRGIAETVQEQIRPLDTLARYGGDEFSIVIEGTADDAARVAERIRASLAVLFSKRGDGAATTASIGVTQYRPGESADDFMRRADEGLYKSKHAGKDRITVV